MNYSAEERRLAELLETESAYQSAAERHLRHAAEVLVNYAERGAPLRGEPFGWVLADVFAALEEIEAAAEYTRQERRKVYQLKRAK